VLLSLFGAFTRLRLSSSTSCRNVNRLGILSQDLARSNFHGLEASLLGMIDSFLGLIQESFPSPWAIAFVQLCAID
jgi:hypothetical protein